MMSRKLSAFANYRNVLLSIGAILLAAIWGIEDVAGQSTTVILLIRLVAGSLVTAIVWVDSIKWKRPLPLLALGLVFLTWPIALPICCARTRRFKGLVKALAFLGLLAVVYVIGLISASTLLERQAYRAHTAGDYEKAVRIYTRLIEYDPTNEWAIENRANAREAIKAK